MIETNETKRPEYEEPDIFPEGLNHSFESRKMSIEAYEKQKQSLFNMGTDLLWVTGINCPCSECAKLQHRIYSFSGNDKRFPKYPEFLKNGGLDHCGLQAYPFIEDISHAYDFHGKVEIYENGMMCFEDRRTDEQKAIYERKILEYKQELLDRSNYEKLKNILNDDAPKSYSSFKRMKKSNSKGYQILVEKAKKHNIEL